MSFGVAIPITGLNVGFLGQVSRTGGGDPFIVSKLGNALNAANINFGDTVVVLPDAAGGTYKQFADFIANGGAVSAGAIQLATSTTATPSTLNGLAPGMFLVGNAAGIPAGTFIVSINQAAGTILMSKAATNSNNLTAYWVAAFGGIAVREVKTQRQFPLAAGASEVGLYQPGELTEALVRGSIATKIYNGIPVCDGPVYIRAILNGGTFPNGIVGGLEAVVDGSNNILVPNATFKTGVLDGNNIAEVTLLSRVSA